MTDFAPTPAPDRLDDPVRRRWLAWVAAAGASTVLTPAAQADAHKKATQHASGAAGPAKLTGAARARGASSAAAPASLSPQQTRWRETGLPPALATRLAATGLPLESFGLYVAPIEGNGSNALLNLNGEESFVLASTAKVVTSMAGLSLLGADYRWRTRAYLRGTLRDGTLTGDLVIVGGGDACLNCDDITGWFARMQRAGLRQITGNIVLDRSVFRLNVADHGDTPEPGQHRPHHQRPDALSVNGGVLRVSVQAGAGAQPEVTVQPPMAALKLVNAVRGSGGCSAQADFVDIGPASELQVHGSWAPSCGVRRIELAALTSEELSLRGFAGLWRAAGGELSGEVLDRVPGSRGAGLPLDPRGRIVKPWQEHVSQPLVDYLLAMNKHSHNVMARHLMLSLAPGFPRKPATLFAAREQMADWLHKQGLQDGDLTMDNGSGLSRAERGRPRALGQLLRQALSMTDNQSFLKSLPIAGVDGTLTTRFQNTPAQGQAYLKTGTLTDTRALAGYVRGQSGRWQVLVAIANHPSAPRATGALDEVVDWVVRNA